MKEPLVSYCIITYNQEHCIREALYSAISQDYENMEIIVSDDNSKDNTYDVIQNFVKHYDGRFNIILNRNPKNLFITGNLNKAIELSHGKYIIFSAGDDTKSGPNSVSQFVRYIGEMGVLSLTSNAYTIDADSVINGTLFPVSGEKVVYGIEEYLSGDIKSCGAARIIDRDLLDIYGMLNDECQTEDSTTNLRAILYKGLGYVSTPLVNYRVDGNNVSAGSSLFTKFDPQKIYNQYSKDLETAKNKELINTSSYFDVKQHIDQYLLFEMTKRCLFKKNSIISRLFFLIKLTFSNKYTFKHIKIYLKLVISWWIHSV